MDNNIKEIHEIEIQESNIKEIPKTFSLKEIISIKINTFFSSSKLEFLESSYQNKIIDMQKLLTDFHQIFTEVNIINKSFLAYTKKNKLNNNNIKKPISIENFNSRKIGIKSLNTITTTTKRKNYLLNFRNKTINNFKNEDKFKIPITKNMGSQKNKINYPNEYIYLTDVTKYNLQKNKSRLISFTPKNISNFNCKNYSLNKITINIEGFDNNVNTPYNNSSKKKQNNRFICNTEYDSCFKITRLFADEPKNLVLFPKDKRKNKIKNPNKFLTFFLDYNNLNALKKLYDFLYLNENLKISNNIFKNFIGPLRDIYLNKCLKEVNSKIEKIADELIIKKDDISLIMEREIFLHKYHKIKEFIDENNKLEINRRAKINE